MNTHDAPTARTPIQVEALTWSDSYESLVDRHFRGRPSHRVEDTAPYQVEKLADRHAESILRSRRGFISTSARTNGLKWASMLLELEEDVFVTVLLNTNAGGLPGVDFFKVTVTAASAPKAAEVLLRLRGEFLPKKETDGPGFYILDHRGNAHCSLLEEKHCLDPLQLSLHYGDEFPDWDQEFQQGLTEPGISIFRGQAGTGKTSYLRHVMSSLIATHRFYFVPVDNFVLLTSGRLTAFWREQQQPDSAMVLVLEDAEVLLMERDLGERSGAAALLNIADGLLSNFLNFHLVCTLNCRMDDIDPALLRPGRLHFFREFGRIPRDRAERLAGHYKLQLLARNDFTLAEVFAPANFSQRTAGMTREPARLGFGK